MTKVALIQMEVALGDVAANRQKALAMIEEGLRQGAKLFVLPEMWTTGYKLDEIHALGEPESGPTVSMLCNVAREHGVEIIAGSIAETAGDKVYNTAYAIKANGDVVAKYRKMHLIGLMSEDRYITSGRDKCLFDMSFGRAGLIICYDLRFLELPRALALAGCQALFVPAEWPSIRGQHWIVLNTARAIENQMFVIAVNAVGSNPQDTFFGHSMIINPWGEVIAAGPDEKEALIVADVDFQSVTEIRQRMPIFADRRPQYY